MVIVRAATVKLLSLNVILNDQPHHGYNFVTTARN